MLLNVLHKTKENKIYMLFYKFYHYSLNYMKIKVLYELNMINYIKFVD